MKVPLISELNYIQNIGIKINGTQFHTVKIITCLFVGDNLEISGMFDFCECFISKFYCRICKNPKQTMQKLCAENNVLRNKENYEQDVKTNEFQLTGVKQSSSFNNINNFHVTQNFFVDVMHDMLEGVCHYDLILIINKFVSDKLLTIELLNFRILNFNYGLKCSNKPPLLSSDVLKKQNFRMSASEMFSFACNLNLIIGDLIPHSDEHWLLYLLLKEILYMIYNPILDFNSNLHFKNLISEHHEIYLKLSNSNLKPKYHNMIHYPMIIDNIGPLNDISSMRFEAKHRPLKVIGRSSNNRKNLIHTISVKCQQNYLFFY